MQQMNDYDRAAAALEFVSPACPRPEWVRTLTAIKALLGEDGRELADTWSQAAPDSYNSADFASAWKSINEVGKVGAGTLFYLAQQNGYKPEGGTTPRAQTPEETAERERRAREAKEREDREAAEAASKAVAIWREATQAPKDHPYLRRKSVAPVATLRSLRAAAVAAILRYPPKAGAEPLSGLLLVVPIKAGENIVSVELIDGEGRKAVIAGSRVSGGYWAAQPMPEGDGDGLTLAIGEGVATVLSAKEATGCLAVAARSCGNLRPVAEAMRAKYPKARIVILSDLGNGEDKARAAAAAVGGFLAFPDFGADRPEGAKDFNDLAAHRGPEAVRKALEAARPPGALPEAQPTPGNRSEPALGPQVAFRCFSDIEARRINWLWPDKIARGKLTVIAGNPGLGKSQVTCFLASVVTAGGSWPAGGRRCEQGAVIYLSAEDDPEDTIKPRLQAAGADVGHCYNLDAVIDGYAADGSERRRSFNLQADLARLEEMIVRVGNVALAIVDPISAYLGDANSHNNAEVRALLSPLSDLAAKYGVAIVAVSHLNKGGSNEAIMRVTGSLAFVAAARAAFIVVQDKEDDARRLFLSLKNNIGPGGSATGLAFKIEPETVSSNCGPINSSRVAWEPDAVSITAQEAMAPPLDPGERSDLDDAMAFLRGVLEDGPVRVKQIQSEANGAGHSWATVRRAQKALGVEATKGGMKEGWTWRLPPGFIPKVLKNPEDAHANGVGAFAGNERLRPDPEAPTDAEIL